MPILTIDTNQTLDSDRCEDLLHKATDLLSTLLDKPKGSIMVRITPDAHLMMADTTEPAAYLELKLFAFQKDRAGEFVESLTEFLHTEMGVSPDRQFQKLIDLDPAMFGWNGKAG